MPIGLPPSMPPVPPPLPGGRKSIEHEDAKPVVSQPEGKPGIGRGPELDSHAMAVALAAAAAKFKEEEMSFEEILQRVIELTGMTNPQEAMEEANRKVQREIEAELERIKKDPELMEEAEAWEDFAKLLEHEMTQEQVSAFVELLKTGL